MTEQNIFYSGELITRQEAKAAGLKRYFTGQPCRHGHISERQATTSVCVQCYRIRIKEKQPRTYQLQKLWRARNGDKVRAQAKRRSSKPHVKARNAERYRQKKLFDPDRLKREVARTKELREAKFTALAGRPRPDKCEICSGGGKISFDHSHKTGKFRGWICGTCNSALGMVRDSPLVLRKLAEYVERNDVEIRCEPEECPASERLRIAS